MFLRTKTHLLSSILSLVLMETLSPRRGMVLLILAVGSSGRSCLKRLNEAVSKDRGTMNSR